MYIEGSIALIKCCNVVFLVSKLLLLNLRYLEIDKPCFRPSMPSVSLYLNTFGNVDGAIIRVLFCDDSTNRFLMTFQAFIPLRIMAKPYGKVKIKSNFFSGSRF